MILAEVPGCSAFSRQSPSFASVFPRAWRDNAGTSSAETSILKGRSMIARLEMARGLVERAKKRLQEQRFDEHQACQARKLTLASAPWTEPACWFRCLFLDHGFWFLVAQVHRTSN